MKTIKKIKVGDLYFQIVIKSGGYHVECNRGKNKPIRGMFIGDNIQEAYQMLYYELYQHFYNLNNN